MGFAEALTVYLSDFADFLVVEPSSEKDLALALYIYLRLLGFDVKYMVEDEPILVLYSVSTAVPIMVRKAGSAGDVDEGVKRLLGHLEKMELKKGVLFVFDASENGEAYARARAMESVTKDGKTVYAVAVYITASR